jgi:tRNA pseudouridine55 synthase
VGHAGTLDPFATGLLLALSGKLTKAAELLSGMDKEYEAVVHFGAETDTLDTEGRIIAEAPVPGYSRIIESLEQFRGEIKQVPPVYSAIKVKGRRAYSQARKGVEIEIPERKVTIHSLEVISWEEPHLKLRIRCSKGTYIRSIAKDLGLAAGSRAYCTFLRRTATGPFSVEDAVSPDEIDSGKGMDPVSFFRKLGIPVVELPGRVAERLRVGVPPSAIPLEAGGRNVFTLYTDEDGSPAALLDTKEGKAVYRIVFDGAI